MATIAFKSIYQLKIELKGAKPPIWRRVLVPSNIRLDKLHEVIQESMGWFNYHLHHFYDGKKYYQIPLEEDDGFWGDSSLDERKYKLYQLLKKEKQKLTYEYDFGDGWEHKIILEKILPFDSEMKLPVCIKGKRACPPEDCGGIWGYEHLLEIISDPTHEEYKEMTEWLGREFDPTNFDLELINELLEEIEI
ncbi:MULTISPECIES: plasmid pRiA4b ORF-3 family protein [Psychrilyobacter]|uniref:Plasmid pRiA4b ORF-3 family protein n=1 Tax=Psychrilyobacter piezotolerans TaxID=2293438 RepID=A0ABX9KF82_9FUSO|nr:MULTISPECIES: plasmid pRiA4b ORF-3 family protein [Psychrilyobacter]MCS5422514.1 plasmid pRiA4b ORF-3 family protein [Psychrilyobacter sp. S5]NDI78626.1 plasmid pRiA4b ORF-3 family protein [Psychrilyobacter piezotolerans]RDE60328.1 plasmid pRiA4b ORF-3 family protein [Psychrilyobacter sp. S5]REI40436.1 plasmid pRiA4b ORF-3 family protein [Psychrilyobacter piezotolerans]